MAKDNLMGAAVRIRRGRHGGRTGKVIVCNRHASLASFYLEIKVQLDGSNETVKIYGEDDLEVLTALPRALAL
ncbi:MAG TPA: hypothetical protein VF544_18400 [Pyrinomonadaceae bacterium]